jgi:hypothetical protein
LTTGCNGDYMKQEYLVTGTIEKQRRK